MEVAKSKEDANVAKSKEDARSKVDAKVAKMEANSKVVIRGPLAVALFAYAFRHL